MFDHVTIRVSDRLASQRFYNAVLDTLGIPTTDEADDLPEWEDFSLLAAEEPSRVTEGLHIGFAAHSRPEVDVFWRTGVDLGARDDGAPGPRPQYRDDYYGGFLLDPDGNSAEAAHHGSRREDGVIDHIWLRVSDIAASTAFYATVGRVAGHQVAEVSPAHTMIRGASGSMSLVAGTPSRNVHIAFPVDDDATVDAFHAVATGAGHPSNGEPGERTGVPRRLLRRVRARPRRQQHRARQPQPLMARAIRFSEHGGTDVLGLAEVPDPEPGPGQVRLAVRAAGVNPFDWKVLHGFVPGLPKAFPAGLGNDVAGVVDALGEGVASVAVGDAVLGQSATPSYATSALAAEDRLIPKPDDLPWEVAAGLGGAGGVAWKVLERLGVSEGETLLVHAAAGGVGTFAVQLAVARGARVIGTASEANHELLRGWGAIPVRYGDGLAERVREVAPGGIDAALDASGRGGELPVSVELAGGPERVLTIARFDDVPEGVTIHGGGSMGDLQPALREIVALIGEGRLQVPIGGTYPLEDAAAALDASEHGHVAGKIALTTS